VSHIHPSSCLQNSIVYPPLVSNTLVFDRCSTLLVNYGLSTSGSSEFGPDSFAIPQFRFTNPWRCIPSRCPISVSSPRNNLMSRTHECWGDLPVSGVRRHLCTVAPKEADCEASTKLVLVELYYSGPFPGCAKHLLRSEMYVDNHTKTMTNSMAKLYPESWRRDRTCATGLDSEHLMRVLTRYSVQPIPRVPSVYKSGWYRSMMQFDGYYPDTSP